MRQLEKALGHAFKNKRLLQEALTHSTYAYEHREEAPASNERLEFLGDAVLDLAVSDALFRLIEPLAEGAMTKTRALVVCENSLAMLARRLEVGKLLFLGRGEAATGGSDKASNLSNAMEALFGAVYLDAGFDKARAVILTLFDQSIREALAGAIVYDYKSQLLEYYQSLPAGGQLKFQIVEESGPDHERVFTAAILIDDQIISQGSGSTKKEAEQQAARSALKTFMV